jgi:hypothetical protein
MPCEDFTITVGKNVVQVVYDFELLRVCWRVLEGPAAGDVVCYGGEDIIRFRDFINERLSRSTTAIVNEFQRHFRIRRQRAFWIVESMLDPRWCVLEVVVEPGCIVWGDEYTRSTYEFGVCLESVVDEGDVTMQLYDAMEEFGIKILDRCGKGAKYGIRMRRIKREEAKCDVIHTDYYTWIRETVAEIASFTTA